MISVIIPTKGRVESLKRCIESVQKYTDVPYELIIVASDPGEEARSYLNTFEKTVKTYVLPGSFKCYSEAMNAGLNVAEGDFLTIPGIADDIEVTQGWIKPVVTMMEADPTIGMGVFAVKERHAGKVFGAFLDEERFNYDPNAEPHYAGYGLVSRACYEKIGPMDENFVPIYLEDADYGMRVMEAGFRLVPCIDSEIIHHHEQEGRAPNAGENKEYFDIKWREWRWK